MTDNVTTNAITISKRMNEKKRCFSSLLSYLETNRLILLYTGYDIAEKIIRSQSGVALGFWENISFCGCLYIVC